jgi:membrane protease YdiL (CAAX protease family)
MAEQVQPGWWGRFPVVFRAIVTGLVVGLVAANVWPLLVLNLGTAAAAAVEVAFLAVYIWWARGGGPPRAWKAARAEPFRAGRLTGTQWFWGLLAALSFAVTVHAAIVVLFRLTPFPAAAFHAGYDFSFIPTVPLRWLAVIVSAASAGICEETGFRGYMQRPIEKRHGALLAILVSSILFTFVHLTKSWSMMGMVPIVFGAGLLLGTLAYASRSLVFCMIGHTLMDIGLFAFWWTQIAGTISQKPISVSGVDQAFYIECGVLAAALCLTLLSIGRLWRTKRASDGAFDMAMPQQA